MTKPPKLYCNTCDDRTCIVETSRKYSQEPMTCLWSNVVEDFVYAAWSPRPGPADIPKKEDKKDG